MRLTRSTQGGIALLMGVVLSLGIYLSGCDGTKPTEPPQPEPVEKDYLVWINVYNRNTLYAYHTMTGQIETVDIPWDINGAPITVSHDGRLIYIPSDFTVKVYDIESGQGVGVIPYNADSRVVVSPDGCYVVIPGDTLRIVRTSDYSLCFEAEERFAGGDFSPDSRTLYMPDCSDYNGGISTVRRSNTGWTIHHNEFSNIIGPAHVVPTPDESRLLLYMNVGMESSLFAVYDVVQDSIIFSEYQSPGSGCLCLTPDGRYAYYGNPGTMFAGIKMPPSEFTEFDVLANRVVKTISTLYITDNREPDRMPVGEIAITPDGRWLIGIEGGGGSGGVLRYDLVKQEMVDYQELNRLALGVSVQLTP